MIKSDIMYLRHATNSDIVSLLQAMKSAVLNAPPSSVFSIDFLFTSLCKIIKI